MDKFCHSWGMMLSLPGAQGPAENFCSYCSDEKGQLKPKNEIQAGIVPWLQKAIEMTASGLREAIRSAEPGMYEYQLEAILEYIYRREGASGPAFTCIIGSGPNSLILHYNSNQRQMQAGDVVAKDVGGEYAGVIVPILHERIHSIKHGRTPFQRF